MTTTETVTNEGTQSLELKTAGWSWYAGGGVEVWLKKFLAVYADGGAIQLRGNALGGAEGSISETMVTASVGVRVHLWK
jgi:hypothetical protein